jgi:hypothetical protein
VYALRLSRDLAYIGVLPPSILYCATPSINIVGVAPINSTVCNTFHHQQTECKFDIEADSLLPLHIRMPSTPNGTISRLDLDLIHFSPLSSSVWTPISVLGYENRLLCGTHFVCHFPCSLESNISPHLRPFISSSN